MKHDLPQSFGVDGGHRDANERRPQAKLSKFQDGETCPIKNQSIGSGRYRENKAVGGDESCRQHEHQRIDLKSGGKDGGEERKWECAFLT